MKKVSVALLACLTLFLFSCKKTDVASPQEPDQTPTGKITPIGTPDGAPAAIKTIGAGGGSLSSHDGRVKIVIPAGALASDQQISVQSISNHNPLGLQQAYRIEPHDVQFVKPVTVQFNYDEEDLMRTIPEALGIAYQNEHGVWMARGGAIVDKNNKTITATTSHFSDWSLFESIYLSVQQPVLPVGHVSKLEVFTDEDLLVPLVPEKELPIKEPQAAAAKYIKEWTLSGAGTLTSNGSLANYKAPASVPQRNPVAVSVRLDLKQRGLFLLIGNITIQNDDGEIEVRVAGGPWVKHVASGATKFGENYYGISDSDGDETGRYIFVRWTGGVGTHGFKDPLAVDGTHAHYQITGVTTYNCFYVLPDKLMTSGGGVTITSMGEPGGFIEGTFIINPAGYGDQLLQTTLVEGRFRVKRYF